MTQIDQLRHKEKELEKDISLLNDAIYSKGQALSCIKKKIEMALTMEIPPEQAPRHGERWTPFDKDVVEEAFRNMCYDSAIKTGRSTRGVRYRVAVLLIRSGIDVKTYARFEKMSRNQE